MRAIVEEGLHRVLADARPTPKPAFKLKEASVPGRQTLVADPQRWREIEEERIAARVDQARALLPSTQMFGSRRVAPGPGPGSSSGAISPINGSNPGLA